MYSSNVIAVYSTKNSLQCAYLFGNNTIKKNSPLNLWMVVYHVEPNRYINKYAHMFNGWKY